MFEPAPGVWFAVDEASSGRLAGFLELYAKGSVVDVGLGLRPDRTGHGLGARFVETALDFAQERWNPNGFALDALPWNERAIRAYVNGGFIRGESTCEGSLAVPRNGSAE